VRASSSPSCNRAMPSTPRGPSLRNRSWR
jgi:hypothetical protein